MPFKEIGRDIATWVSFGSRGRITISKKLRDNYLDKDKKIRVFYDEENSLLGLKPDEEGYSVSEGVITCRMLPEVIEFGKYSAEWDSKQDMFIVNLTKKIL